MNEKTENEVLHRIENNESNIETIMNLLHGESGRLGILGKTAVMWRVYVWVLCSVSAGFGAALTMIIQRLVSKGE